MPIDHLSLNVTDYARSKAFYDAAFAPLGVKGLMEFGPVCGYGKAGKPDFWIGAHKADFQTDEQLKVLTPIHVALVADDRAAVDAFYQAALAAGGRDNGKPGIRANYHPNYYAAFVLDPDGHNIEAVCHR